MKSQASREFTRILAHVPTSKGKRKGFFSENPLAVLEAKQLRSNKPAQEKQIRNVYHL